MTSLELQALGFSLERAEVLVRLECTQMVLTSLVKEHATSVPDFKQAFLRECVDEELAAQPDEWPEEAVAQVKRLFESARSREWRTVHEQVLERISAASSGAATPGTQAGALGQSREAQETLQAVLAATQALVNRANAQEVAGQDQQGRGQAAVVAGTADLGKEFTSIMKERRLKWDFSVEVPGRRQGNGSVLIRLNEWMDNLTRYGVTGPGASGTVEARLRLAVMRCLVGSNSHFEEYAAWSETGTKTSKETLKWMRELYVVEGYDKEIRKKLLSFDEINCENGKPIKSAPVPERQLIHRRFLEELSIKRKVKPARDDATWSSTLPETESDTADMVEAYEKALPDKIYQKAQEIYTSSTLKAYKTRSCYWQVDEMVDVVLAFTSQLEDESRRVAGWGKAAQPTTTTNPPGTTVPGEQQETRKQKRERIRKEKESSTTGDSGAITPPTPQVRHCDWCDKDGHTKLKDGKAFCNAYKAALKKAKSFTGVLPEEGEAEKKNREEHNGVLHFKDNGQSKPVECHNCNGNHKKAHCPARSLAVSKNILPAYTGVSASVGSVVSRLSVEQQCSGEIEDLLRHEKADELQARMAAISCAYGSIGLEDLTESELMEEAKAQLEREAKITEEEGAWLMAGERHTGAQLQAAMVQDHVQAMPTSHIHYIRDVFEELGLEDPADFDRVHRIGDLHAPVEVVEATLQAVGGMPDRGLSSSEAGHKSEKCLLPGEKGFKPKATRQLRRELLPPDLVLADTGEYGSRILVATLIDGVLSTGTWIDSGSDREAIMESEVRARGIALSTETGSYTPFTDGGKPVTGVPLTVPVEIASKTGLVYRKLLVVPDAMMPPGKDGQEYRVLLGYTAGHALGLRAVDVNAETPLGDAGKYFAQEGVTGQGKVIELMEVDADTQEHEWAELPDGPHLSPSLVDDQPPDQECQYHPEAARIQAAWAKMMPDHLVKTSKDPFMTGGDPDNPDKDRPMVEIKVKPGMSPAADPIWRVSDAMLAGLRVKEKAQLKKGIKAYATKEVLGDLPEMPPLNLVVTKKKDMNGNTRYIPNEEGVEVLDVRDTNDLRSVNKVLDMSSEDVNYKMPEISMIITFMSLCAVMSLIDLEGGFPRIKVHPNSRRYLTYFSHSLGVLLCYMGAPQGLSSMPQFFQRQVNRVLQGLAGVLAYIDDISAGTMPMANPTLEADAHIATLVEVQERLTKHNLRIATNKCIIGATGLYILGFYVSRGCVHLDQRKLRDIDNWPVPRTVKELWSFIGLVGYFRMFLPAAAMLLAPLEWCRAKAMQTKSRLHWGYPQQLAFRCIKRLLRRAPILHQPDYAYPLYIATDASTYGISAVLLQVVEGKVKIIGMWSKSLRVGRNYSCYKREAAAVVFALQKAHPYIDGRKVTVFTDHKALLWLFTPKESDNRGALSTWPQLMSRYQLQFFHLPGLLLTLPDALSRVLRDLEGGLAWYVTKASGKQMRQSITQEPGKKPIRRKKDNPVVTSSSGAEIRVEDVPDVSTWTQKDYEDMPLPDPFTGRFMAILQDHDLDVERADRIHAMKAAQDDTPSVSRDEIEAQLGFPPEELFDEARLAKGETILDVTELKKWKNKKPAKSETLKWETAPADETKRIRVPPELVECIAASVGSTEKELHDVMPDAAPDGSVMHRSDVVNFCVAPIQEASKHVSEAFKQADILGADTVMLLPVRPEEPWYQMMLTGLVQRLELGQVRGVGFALPGPDNYGVYLVTPEAARRVDESIRLEKEIGWGAVEANPQSSSAASSGKEGVTLNSNADVEWIRDRLHAVQRNLSEQEKEDLIVKEHSFGHVGVDKVVTSLVEKGYHWPGMNYQAMTLIGGCKPCLKFNVAKRGYHPTLPINAEVPLDHVAIDVWHAGVRSQEGYTCALSLTDICTGFLVLLPLESESAQNVAKQLFFIFCLMGFPRILQSDNAPNTFATDVMKELKELTGMQHQFVSEYASQGNGRVERKHRDVNAILNKEVPLPRTDWPSHLPRIMLEVNQCATSRLKNTRPFSAFFGRQLNLFKGYESEVVDGSTLLTEKELADRMEELRKVVWPALHAISEEYGKKMAQDKDARRQDKGDRRKSAPRIRVDVDLFAVGDEVMVEIPKDRRKSKVDDRWEGPYTVVEQLPRGGYKLKGIIGDALPRTYRPQQLKRCRFPGQYGDTTDVYDAHYLLGHRLGGADGREKEYLVKWKGYGHRANSWEPVGNLLSESLVRNYWARMRQKHGDDVVAAPWPRAEQQARRVTQRVAGPVLSDEEKQAKEAERKAREKMKLAAQKAALDEVRPGVSRVETSARGRVRKVVSYQRKDV